MDKTLWDMNADVEKSVKGIVVTPELTPEQICSISDQYVETLTRNIKGWTQKRIEKLRREVTKRAQKGMRHESLEELLVRSWKLDKSRAKFIARQETKLAQVSFIQSRYQKAGIDEYFWECVSGTKAHPVRKRHRELNDESARGKTFRFSNPPRSSEDGQPPRYNNPGEDYNCRCRARPVLKF